MNAARPVRLILCTLALLLPPPAVAQDEPNPGEIVWEPYSTTGSDDQPLQGEIGRLRVPENRSVKNGRTIELAFVRFRTSNPEPGPPIVFLAGGPGGSGIEGCIGPATGRRTRLIDVSDVIGLDQRGTGLSQPNLSEGPPFTYDLPTDRAITRLDVMAAHKQAVKRCVDHWKRQGVDLSAYTSVESADDIDDVRKALGIDKLITWGASYGSHLSLAYLRRHADHVERSVLMKVEGPDHTLKLPSTTQRHLIQLHELVAADPELARQLPDVLGTVRTLLEQLRKKPVKVTVNQDGTQTSVTIGPFDLQYQFSNMLGEVFQLAEVPDFVARMARGDWTRMGSIALENRHGDVGSAMALMMDCASGGSAPRLARIARETADKANLLSDAVNVPYPAACAACGDPDLGDEFRGPLQCDVPVLFVSGDLDARTPPGNVDEIRGGFSNHAHVLAVNVGHEPLEVLSEEYCALLQAFLRGEPVESCTFTLPPVRWKPIGSD